jgi:hypothetical protein
MTGRNLKDFLQEMDNIVLLHDLKIARHQWASVALSLKTFEIRLNDRDFKEGHHLLLRAWVSTYGYSGEWSLVHVPYILSETRYGMQDNHIIMSIDQIMYGHSDEWKKHPQIVDRIAEIK